MSWLVFCTVLHWVLVPMSQSCCRAGHWSQTGLETCCPCPPPTGLPAQERRCPVRERVLGLSAGGSHSRKVEDDGVRACSQVELLMPFSCLYLCSPSQKNSSCFFPISGLNPLFMDISLCRVPSHFFLHVPLFHSHLGVQHLGHTITSVKPEPRTWRIFMLQLREL